MQVEATERVQFQSANHDIPHRHAISGCSTADTIPNAVRDGAKVVVMPFRNWIVLRISLRLLYVALNASTTRFARGRHTARISTTACSTRQPRVGVALLALTTLLIPAIVAAQDVTLTSPAEVIVGANPGRSSFSFQTRTATTLVTADVPWIAVECDTSRRDEVLANGCRLLLGTGTYSRTFLREQNPTRTRRTGRVSIGDVVVTVTQEAGQSDWNVIEGGGYSIYFATANRADGEKVRMWVDAVREPLLAKYGLSTLGRRVSIYLHPEPVQIAQDQNANENAAVAINDTGSTSIHLLTPSSPRYANTSSLGISKTTDDYHAKVVVHEFVHAIQATVTATTGNTASFLRNLKEYLAEYDGLYHSTAANLASAPSLLAKWGNRNRNAFVCCQTLADTQSLVINDDYNGGALFMRFIAERYGESMHSRLLETRESTLVSALLRETQVASAAVLFSDFRQWSFGWAEASAATVSRTTAANLHAMDVPNWLEARRSNYTIFYQAGFEPDVEFARTWMDRAEDVMRTKYGVSASDYSTSLYLHPSPTNGATVFTTTLTCCTQQPNGKRAAAIQFLAPSASEWRTTPFAHPMGLTIDENYQALVLMHEYITLGHLTTQSSRTATGAWQYYDAATPSWFVQGLQTFDGIFHSTAANRSLAFAGVGRWGNANREGFVCCQTLGEEQSLLVGDAYSGGLLFHIFLTSRFGEDLHRRLLLSPEPTFYRALTKETGSSIGELFVVFREWFQTFCATCPKAINLTTTATLNVSAAAGSTSVGWTAETSWTASTSADWLTWPLSVGGRGNWGRNLEWSANSSATPRTGTLTLTGGGASVTVTVVQAGSR